MIYLWFLKELHSNQIFTNPVVQTTFPRYLKILQNQTLARFLLAKQFSIDPEILMESDEKKLWEEYNAISNEFRSFVENRGKIPDEISKKDPNYLDLKIHLAKILESPCRLCERKCERNRHYPRFFRS